MFLGVLLLILTTLSSFSSPALRAGPPDTTCDWTMEEILAPDWLLTWDTNSPVSAGENLSPALETTERPNPWGPRLEQASMLDSEELFYILFSPDFNVQSLHFKIVSFLLADFQDSVLRIYRQKLHELFLLYLQKLMLILSQIKTWLRLPAECPVACCRVSGGCS